MTPVFADVLKQPENSLDWANDWRVGSFSLPSSKRSILFSTKRHGSFPPSKNLDTSSTDDFHLMALKFNKLLYKINLTLL